MAWKMRVSDLYLIKKDSLVVALFYGAMLLVYFWSLHPWFLWKVESFVPIVAGMLCLASMAISRTMANPVFTRKEYLFPIISFVLLLFYERMVNGVNINGFIVDCFHVLVFFTLFRFPNERLKNLSTVLAKTMATLLAFSLMGHFMYLMGLPLPGGHDAQYNEFYSFTNYYLFLLDDRNLFTLVPRFNSVFLEPGHIGTAAVFLLFIQRGQWRKWYNIVLMIAAFFSFSLAAYIFFVIIVFLNMWIERKKIAQKLLLSLLLLASAVIATFTYNKGNNLVHDLIALRLEMEDGEMEGDNRVTFDFDAEFESFLQSSDILFGREMDKSSFGNAGYRVYIYENGFVGLVLLLLFYLSVFMYARNYRALLSAMFLALLYFIVNAFMIWENIFMPFYIATYMVSTSHRKGTEDLLTESSPLETQKIIQS